MQEENEKRLNYLEQASDFIRRYKRKFQLNEDDVQDIKIKFWENYVDDKGCSPNSFVKILMDQHNIIKWKKAASPKHAHIAIQLDKHDGNYDGSRFDWLEELISSNNNNMYLAEMDLEQNREVLQYLMARLRENELEIITRIYYNNETEGDIAKEKGLTRARINDIKRKALKKMKLK